MHLHGIPIKPVSIFIGIDVPALEASELIFACFGGLGRLLHAGRFLSLIAFGLYHNAQKIDITVLCMSERLG